MPFIVNLLYTIYLDIMVIVITIISTSICILLSLLFGNHVGHKVAQCWAKSILLFANIDIKLECVENIDPNKAYIFMPNHQSYFDIPVLLSYIPGQFRWLAKAELFKIPLFGASMRAIGYVPINRSDRKEAFKSLDTLSQNIKQNVSVLIFPEGTRSKNGEIGSFKKGGFVMAMESKAMIMPIAIYGTWYILPRHSYIMKRHPITMRFLPPIDPNLFETKEELMKAVHQTLCQGFGYIKNKPNQNPIKT